MKGHTLVALYLRPDQRDALQELAGRRQEPGKRPPVSEVARELLDKALGLKRGRK